MKKTASKKTNEYHNTTKLKEPLLSECTTKALTQNSLVLYYFQGASQSMIQDRSPSQCHTDLINVGVLAYHTPLTSIRRSISTLTKRKLLRKTNIQINSTYDRPEYTWELV